MSSQSPTVLQKLTFLVLLGILGCLVVIILKNPSARIDSVSASDESPAQEAQEPEPTASSPSAPLEPQPAARPLPRPVVRATSIAVANAAPPRFEAQPV